MKTFQLTLCVSLLGFISLSARAAKSDNEYADPEHPSFFDLQKLEPCARKVRGDGLAASLKAADYANSRAVDLQPPETLPASFKALQDRWTADYRNYIREDEQHIKEAEKELSAALKNDVIYDTGQVAAGLTRAQKDLQLDQKLLATRGAGYWQDGELGIAERDAKVTGIGYELGRVKDGRLNIWRVWPNKDGKPSRLTVTPTLTISESSVHPKFFAAAGEGKYASFDEAFNKNAKTEFTTPTDIKIETLKNGNVMLTTSMVSTSHFGLDKLGELLDLPCDDYMARQPAAGKGGIPSGTHFGN